MEIADLKFTRSLNDEDVPERFANYHTRRKHRSWSSSIKVGIVHPTNPSNLDLDCRKHELDFEPGLKAQAWHDR